MKIGDYVEINQCSYYYKLIENGTIGKICYIGNHRTERGTIIEVEVLTGQWAKNMTLRKKVSVLSFYSEDISLLTDEKRLAYELPS